MTITMGTYINISNIGWKSTLTPPFQLPQKWLKKPERVIVLYCYDEYDDELDDDIAITPS